MDSCNYHCITNHHILINNPTFLSQKLKKEFRCIYGYKNHTEHNVLITWVQIKSWERLLYEFSQAFHINNFTRTIVFNTCEVIHMSGDILNADENIEYEDEYGFTGSFLNPPPIIIDNNTKI